MDKYRRPSLKAISTFESAARHESFKDAAKELSLTPSAISHQVKQLEQQVGVNLFHRLSGGLAITDAGAAYLKLLGPAFAEIDDATKQVMQLEYSDQLTIRSTPSFASKWLLDRLPDFLEKHRDIDVKIIATSELLDFRKKNRHRYSLRSIDMAREPGQAPAFRAGFADVQSRTQEQTRRASGHRRSG